MCVLLRDIGQPEHISHLDKKISGGAPHLDSFCFVTSTINVYFVLSRLFTFVHGKLICLFIEGCARALSTVSCEIFIRRVQFFNSIL